MLESHQVHELCLSIMLGIYRGGSLAQSERELGELSTRFDIISID